MTRRDPRMILSDNLNRLARKKGKNPTEVARDLKIASQTVRDWFLGNNYPRPLNTQKLADYFHVEISDLTEEPKDSSKIKAKANTIQIPIIGNIKAGPNGIAEQQFEGYSPVNTSKMSQDFDYYWLKIFGNSMIGDGILDGDLALIKKTPIFRNGDICAVLVDGEEGTLKHITKDRNTIVLTSSNPSYPPRTFVGENCKDILISGKLIQIKRDYD